LHALHASLFFEPFFDAVSARQRHALGARDWLAENFMADHTADFSFDFFAVDV
jgi:hypothetical protein